MYPCTNVPYHFRSERCATFAVASDAVVVMCRERVFVHKLVCITIAIVNSIRISLGIVLANVWYWNVKQSSVHVFDHTTDNRPMPCFFSSKTNKPNNSNQIKWLFIHTKNKALTCRQNNFRLNYRKNFFSSYFLWKWCGLRFHVLRFKFE